MSDISKLNLFNFLIFVSLIHEIRGELEDFKEQITRRDSKNIDATTAITFATTVAQFTEKFNTNQLSEEEMKVTELTEHNELCRKTRQIKSISLHTRHFETRDTTNATITTTTTHSPLLASPLDCYYCSATTYSRVRDPCYVGGRYVV